MRTRRGVERHPTGDSDLLSQMLYESASVVESQRRRPKKAEKEEDEEGTIKTQQESCDEEEIFAAVIDEEPKKKEGPICTRRGVQRRSTGDSDQLGLMLYGSANPSRCVGSDSSGGGIPTEISLSLASSDTTATTAVTEEPRRRGRRKTTDNV